jgi:ABC-type branched-subunit amino acid transport system substrate-binding protein
MPAPSKVLEHLFKAVPRGAPTCAPYFVGPSRTKSKHVDGLRATAGAFPALALGLCLAACLAAGCVPVTRPVLKIGLVAPFEGRYRDVGYEVIYAVRLAVREANAAGGVAGYSIELTALDDSGDAASAAEQARKLGTDPQIMGAIGDWLDATTLEAAPVYAGEGIPFLSTGATALPPAAYRLWLTASAEREAAATGELCPLPCDTLENLDWLQQTRASGVSTLIFGPPLWGQPQFVALAGNLAEGVRFIAPAPLPADSTDPSFADRYRAISGGVEPRSNAVLAYDAARLLFAAIAQSAHTGAPTRAGVAAALAALTFQGLSGAIHFDTSHNWAEAKGWVYEWRAGQIRRP